MNRLALTLAAAALVVPTTQAPRLRIAEPSPLIVSGSGFKTLEGVKVTAFGRQGTLVRRVVATRTGTFRVRFAAAADWCDGVREIRATGRKGSKAAVWVKPAEAGCAAP